MRTPSHIWLYSFAVIGILCNTHLHATDLHVFAAASLADALNEIGGGYSKKTGTQVQFNFAGSGILARQIAEGAPADLFFSDDEAKMDGLEKKGLLLVGTRRTLVANTLVIVVPPNTQVELKSTKDLVLMKTLALGEPDSVPAGGYARDFLIRSGLWETLKERIIPLENVRATLSSVEGGNADAGIVYKTDALTSKKVKIAFELSPEVGPKVSYPIATLSDTNAPKQCADFEDYLGSPEALAVFRKLGFLVAPNNKAP